MFHATGGIRKFYAAGHSWMYPSPAPLPINSFLGCFPHKATPPPIAAPHQTGFLHWSHISWRDPCVFPLIVQESIFNWRDSAEPVLSLLARCVPPWDERTDERIDRQWEANEAVNNSWTDGFGVVLYRSYVSCAFQIRRRSCIVRVAGSTRASKQGRL